MQSYNFRGLIQRADWKCYFFIFRAYPEITVIQKLQRARVHRALQLSPMTSLHQHFIFVPEL